MITLVDLFFCLIKRTIHPFFSLYRFFALSLLDSCDERVMRTDVDDNKSGDQQNDDDDDDEIIKDMKYDFFSLFFFFPTFFFCCSLFFFPIYCFDNLWIVKKLYPLHPVTGTLSIPLFLYRVLFLLLTKPIVYVYMIVFFFSFLFSYFPLYLYNSTNVYILYLHVWMFDCAYSHETHVFIKNS